MCHLPMETLSHKLFKSQLILSVAVKHLKSTADALAVGIASLQVSVCIFHLRSFISQTNLCFPARGLLKSVYLNIDGSSCKWLALRMHKNIQLFMRVDDFLPQTTIAQNDSVVEPGAHPSENQIV